MLTSLHIRDFAIIDQLDLELSAGMTALTGETGAGKSILLGALGLLLGDRADAGSVRHGTERADLSASFDIQSLPMVTAWLKEQSLDHDENECQLRRVIHSEGRSRAFINGTAVPLQSLRTLGEWLVDIHGQHEHQSLMQRSAQRELLDSHGQHQTLLKQLMTAYQQWHSTDQKIAALLGKGQDRDSRLEFLRFQNRELEDLALQEGELENLHDEHKRLANAEQLIDTCQHNLDILYQNDDQAVYSNISQALHDVNELAKLDPSLGNISDCLNNALIQIQEAVDQITGYQQRLELDPSRLKSVEQRLDLIHTQARKHRIEAEALPALAQQLESELKQLEQADEILIDLEKQRDEAKADYLELAKKLHRKRMQTARKLGQSVTRAMQELGMEGGLFEIAVSQQKDHKPGPHGTDQIEFLVSANPGQPPKPLTKVASGGELSRISLAIQVIAAQAVSIPTLIFDEIDTGVGGAVAETVGHQLQALGKNRQVLCVTHLPQVAAQAHHHLQVSKLTGDETTKTRIRTLEESERVDEIARMLGGRKITESTRKHAEEMLGSGKKAKRKKSTG